MTWTTLKQGGLVYRIATTGEYRAVITSVDVNGGQNWWDISRLGYLVAQGTAPTVEAAQERIYAKLDQYATA